MAALKIAPQPTRLVYWICGRCEIWRASSWKLNALLRNPITRMCALSVVMESKWAAGPNARSPC